MASNDQAAQDGTDLPLAWTPGDIRYRVLLALPDARTIPVFALGVEAGRPALDTKVISSPETLSGLVGGNLSRALQSRYGEHRLIGVRRRVDKRTAIYTHWLAFPEMAQAEAFVRDHPRFGLNGIEQKATAELASAHELLERQVGQGRFDLNRYEPPVRVSRAKEYVERAEALDQLAWGLSALSKSPSGEFMRDLRLLRSGAA
jgi:hypothetical protein